MTPVCVYIRPIFYTLSFLYLTYNFAPIFHEDILVYMKDLEAGPVDGDGCLVRLRVQQPPASMAFCLANTTLASGGW